MRYWNRDILAFVLDWWELKIGFVFESDEDGCKPVKTTEEPISHRGNGSRCETFVGGFRSDNNRLPATDFKDVDIRAFPIKPAHWMKCEKKKTSGCRVVEAEGLKNAVGVGWLSKLHRCGRGGQCLVLLIRPGSTQLDHLWRIWAWCQITWVSMSNIPALFATDQWSLASSYQLTL